MFLLKLLIVFWAVEKLFTLIIFLLVGLPIIAFGAYWVWMDTRPPRPPNLR